MSEFKALQAEKKTQRAERCGKCMLCAQVLELPKKKLADFYEAMLTKSITNEVILDVLKGWDVKTSVTTITNHRNGRNGLAKHMAAIKKAANT